MFPDNRFIFMNKNEELLLFESNRAELGIVTFTELERYSDILPLSFDNISDWISTRQAPKHREHMRNLLRQCGCDDLDGFIRVSHALGLNDTFWIKPEGSDLSWDDVSLYQNPFNETIARIAFEGGLYGEHFSSTSPELITDGSYAKCWIRNEDEILLLKRGTSGARNTGLEPYSEYYAAQLGELICRDNVSYDLITHHGKLASSCKLFTDEKTGFTPVWKILSNKSTPVDILDYFDSIGAGESFRRMLVLDALILNTDRHMGNYGILVDNDTQDVIGMAPVFDNNQALLPYAEQQDFKDMDRYLESRPTKIGTDFNETAHWALTHGIKKDLNNLRGFRFTRHRKYNLPEERLQILEDVIDKQITRIINDIRLYVPDVSATNKSKAKER